MGFSQLSIGYQSTGFFPSAIFTSTIGLRYPIWYENRSNVYTQYGLTEPFLALQTSIGEVHFYGIQSVAYVKADAPRNTQKYIYGPDGTDKVWVIPLDQAVDGIYAVTQRFFLNNNQGEGGTGATIREILNANADALFSGTKVVLTGDIGGDHLELGDRVGVIYTGEGNDTALGGALADSLYGWIGNDSLTGNGGNDTIFGDQGLDELFGGDDDDFLVGGLEDDAHFGGLGNDLFDQALGINQGAGNDKIYGGDAPFLQNEVDVVAYADTARSDWRFTDLADGSTVVENVNTGERDTLVGIEHVQFLSYEIDNNITIAKRPFELAIWAFRGYTDNFFRPGWVPVHAHEMEMPTESASGSLVSWTFRNGVYSANPVGIDPFFSKAAVAHVGFGVDAAGNTTLSISFRGTSVSGLDILPDAALGWGPWMGAYYELFRPLIDGVKSLIETYKIEKVLVSGHSLGGAMAQYFMDEFDDTAQTWFRAVTFGSPGAAFSGEAFDPRILHIVHTEDIVTRAPYDTQGSTIYVTLDDPNLSLDDGLRTYEHSMELYLQTMRNLRDLGLQAPNFFSADTWLNQDYVIAVGSVGDDRLAGASRPYSTLLGMPTDDDSMWGGGGNDVVLGGTGRDTIYGGGGRDRLVGGIGADELYGGAGADVFRFIDSDIGKIDRIMDFEVGVDRIDLSAIDANPGTIANDAFVWRGSGLFRGTAGEIRFVTGSTNELRADLDGDRQADFIIRLAGGAIVSQADVIL